MKKKILIVEDDKNQLSALKSVIPKIYNVITATNLKDAKRAIQLKPDIIISDVRLKEEDIDNKDGLVFLKEVKKNNINIPFIVMTAHGDTKIQAESRKIGVFDYLPKPVSLDALEQIIDKAALSIKKNGFHKFKLILSRWIPPFLFFVLFIFILEGILSVFNVPEYIFPHPSNIFLKISGTLGLLLTQTAVTMLEAILGFIFGSAIGFTLAIGFAHSKLFEKCVYPYMIALKAVPLVALAPLLIMWFGDGLLSKVIMSAIMCFFPALVNTAFGLKSVEQDALFLMQSLSASKWDIFLKLRLPTSLPYFFSALKISSSLAVVGAIVAELMGSKRGIGYTILISTYHLDTLMLFSAILAASIASIIFFGVIAWLEKVFLYWHEATG